MFSFAPPVKVARTQRLDASLSHSTSQLARPTTLEDSVIKSGDIAVTPSLFLSGIGEHMAWRVDENQKMLRLWNLSNPSWRRTAPRLAKIPYFAAAEEGLPLFVCEMGEAEESLALCTERGAVSSLDRSVEFRLLDGDDAVTASCFTCARRADCGDVVLTAIGTTSGSLVADRKESGARVTLSFDRLAPGLPAFPGWKDPRGGFAASVMGRGSSSPARRQQSRLWGTVRSFLKGGAADADRDRIGRSRVAENEEESGEGAGDAEGLAFTHAVFRRSYPREIVAVNAAAEVMLLEMREDGMAPRWITNVQTALDKAGYVVAVAETRHKVSVLFLTTPAPGPGHTLAPLPALMLATFSSSQGSLIHVVQVNAIADVTKAAAEVPRHHVTLFVEDSHAHAVIFVRHFCLRVNIQVGVRSPCVSADTSVLNSLSSPLCTTLRPDGSAVTLGIDGPVATWDNLWDCQPPPVVSVPSDRDGASFMGSSLPDLDADVEKRITDMLRAVQADGGRLTLDAAVLQCSEDIFTQRRPHRGNWARADLNAEDENIVLHVTRDLHRRQQLHRRFLVALLRRAGTAQQLQPETIAQLVSAQEALLCQVGFRSLQNMGLVAAPSSPCSTAFQAAFSIARPFAWDEGSPLTGRPTNASSGGGDNLKLLESAEQVERCQQILRRAILHIAKDIRSRAAEARRGHAAHQEQPEQHHQQRRHKCGDEDVSAIESATAVELAFSNPMYATAMLRQVGEVLLDTSRSAVVGSDEKLACAHAAACIFAIAAQTITESRENLKEMRGLSPQVCQHLWTATEDPTTGIQLAFTHVCTTLSSVLVDAVQVPMLQRQSGHEEGAPSPSSAGAAHARSFVDRVGSAAPHLQLLDLMGYLLQFCFSSMGHAVAGGSGGGLTVGSECGAQGGDPAVSSLIKETLLREPLVAQPFGYPFGVPTATAHGGEVSRHALRMAETLAMQFDGVDVLLACCLSTPTEDPQPHEYSKLQLYCQHNPRMLSFALEALWLQRREWELLCLPSVLPAYSPTAAARDAFLERRAPHLLWLAAPDRFDALAWEGGAAPLYVSYGPTQLSHRSRCLSVGKLAWVAASAPRSSAYDALALEAALVACQQRFLSPQCDDTVLGLQDLVQRLLALERNVAAWVGAAAVAARAHTALAEDLLVQVMRKCKQHDGNALAQLYADSVSEVETMQAMRHTAVGAVVEECATLQSAATLQRICETVLTPEEFHIVASWLDVLQSGGGHV